MEEKETIGSAIVHQKESVSIYWFLPFIALLIAGWLVYKNFVEGDIEVKVLFESATGLIEGKTELKYQGMTLGVLDRYELDPKDMKGVIATLRLKSIAKPLLTENSQLWLVKPEVNFSGVTGLETLLSGNYIQLLYKEGLPTRNFVALSEPPLIPQSDKGLELTLISDRLGSVVRGAPVSHRRIEVGEVVDYHFDEGYKKVAIKVYIQPEFVDVINASTRFWESSGVAFTGDFSGFKVKMDSLASLITGGISFDTPDRKASDDESVQDGHRFTLFDDYEKAHTGILVYVKFKTAKGLKVGKTEVQYKGVTVGRVIDVKPTADLDGMIATISMDPRTEPALNENLRFWLPRPKLSLNEISGLETILGPGIIEIDSELEGKPERNFVALSEAPRKNRNEPGLHITLVAQDLKSIERGTDILYRNISIGSVQGFDFSKDHQAVYVDVFVKPAYQHLVKKDSRFWNAGGLSIHGGLQGLKIQSPSVKTILSGGIELYTPSTSLAKHAKSGQKFVLHEDYDSAHSEGIKIKIAFKSGDGLQVGTKLKYLGINVGSVTDVVLNDALDGVTVIVDLNSSAEQLARSGSQFWLVKPELSLVKTTNLETLVTGKYINVSPGSGAQQTEFVGLESKPVQEEKSKGLNIVIVTERLGSLKPGVKVLYRDVPVGEVTAFSLAEKANEVEVFINIEDKFAPLVRQNSVFWNASGIGMDFSLFGGAKIKTSSLESILEGGIAFATPPESKMGDAVGHGYRFRLFPEVNERWLSWKPEISLKR
ncbi:intermembrane transport protein PqiB [Litoribacillus peritrichatus]|uniref:PqiB family protein n=1 Tax=Litoribacillus peritrichatus TaxID=718191 RepID=A0ABP7NAP9_9GAMM